MSNILKAILNITQNTIVELKNNSQNISITDIEIKNPDNPAQLLNAKLITAGVNS